MVILYIALFAMGSTLTIWGTALLFAGPLEAPGVMVDVFKHYVIFGTAVSLGYIMLLVFWRCVIFEKKRNWGNGVPDER